MRVVDRVRRQIDAFTEEFPDVRGHDVDLFPAPASIDLPEDPLGGRRDSPDAILAETMARNLRH